MLKIKVIGENEDNGKEFKVRKMHYNEVIANYPSAMGYKSYNYEDVELISEGEIDDFLIENKEFLKIKLNRGISVFFYKALKDSLEEEIDEKLVDFNLLKDKYNVNKRGIWNKEIIGVINSKLPVEIKASGQNFKRENYSVEVKPIEMLQFVEGCSRQISIIKLEIQRKKIMIENYNKAMKNVMDTRVDDKNLIIE
ncbi:MAG: hypothetical protein PUE01_08350 [Clostridiaceae bacterium]|nr:hypothetical protein [Clostridiaceae bacterium]